MTDLPITTARGRTPARTHAPGTGGLAFAGPGAPGTAPSRYTGNRRSPGAMAAAIAINGGIFALLVALPATHYVIERDPPLETISIPLERVPPEVEPEPAKEAAIQPTQQTVERPTIEPLPFIQPPPIPFDGMPDITGTQEPTTPAVAAEPEPAPAHKPVFKGATRDPRYADAFRPDYPPALRRLGLEGSATLRITIDEKGRVVAVEMVKATDPAFFREAKEQALRHWRFLPATSDGKPVQSQQVLTVLFDLED